MFCQKVRSRVKSGYKVEFCRWAAFCYRCLDEADRMAVDVAVLSAQIAGGVRFRRLMSHRVAAFRVGEYYVAITKDRGRIVVLEIQKDGRSARPERKTA